MSHAQNEPSVVESSTPKQTLAEQVLTLITQQPNVDIISPVDDNKTVSLDELENQIQTIEASDIGLQFDDFAHVINTFSEQLSLHQQNAEPTSAQQETQASETPHDIFHLDMTTFFSFTLLHKIGVLSDSLHRSEACAHIEPQLENLNQTLVFAPLPTPAKKTSRRRASLHRANLQLNRKRNCAPTNSSSINCLYQCDQDLQQWEHDLLAHFMEASGELLHFTPVDFNRAIERLITIHHHWRLLLQNHLKRLHVWLFNQLQLKQITLANEGISTEQAAQCFEQLHQNAQTFNEQLQNNDNSAAHNHEPSQEQGDEQSRENQANYDNYLISRHQIQLLLAQPKLIHTASPLLTNRVFVLYEPNHKLTDKLCHMLSLHQKLIELFWYDVCHLSESICQLETEQFNRQTLQCFYQAQNFKNHLVNVSVGIENLANQLHVSATDVLTALSRTQHHLLDLVHYQTQIFTENTATIGKVTIHHSEQGQFAQLTQVEYAATLVELMQTFDDIVAAISYRHFKPLEHIQLSQVQKLTKMNLDTLNHSMDNAYGNWLQLLNLLRSNDAKQGNNEYSAQSVEQSDNLKHAAQQALSELIEFGPLYIPANTHPQLVPALQMLACLDLNWSTPSDNTKPKSLDEGKLDNLLTALSQNHMTIPNNASDWIKLLMPQLGYQTSLITLAEQQDQQTERKQDVVGHQDIIALCPNRQQGDIEKLILAAFTHDSLHNSEKVILHAPNHLVIHIHQGQEHLTISNKLKLDTTGYQLSALLCQSEQGDETWVNYQKAWFRCQNDGIISVTISDKLPQLALHTQYLVYSLED